MRNNCGHHGFHALLATQFLGSFNSNGFKIVLATLIIDFCVPAWRSFYLALSGAVFILPFILFSTYSGHLADQYSKRSVIIFTKILEVFVIALGFLALLSGKVWPMIIVLFLMGLQSALSNPSKYGILAEILEESNLSEGNGLIQMWSYMAILLGHMSYGLLMNATAPDYYKTTYIFFAISVLGVLASLFVKKVPPSGAHPKWRINILEDLINRIRWIQKDQMIFLSVLGVTYFSFVGGVGQLNLLLFARKVLAVGHLQTAVLISALTFGIGTGCLLSGKLAGKKIALGHIRLGGFGVGLFFICLGITTYSYVLSCVCIFLLGCSGGFYIVPLHTLIQQRSPKQQRGGVIAANNVLAYSAVFLGSLFFFVLREIIHLNAAQIFVTMGIVTLTVMACTIVYLNRKLLSHILRSINNTPPLLLLQYGLVVLVMSPIWGCAFIISYWRLIRWRKVEVSQYLLNKHEQLFAHIDRMSLESSFIKGGISNLSLCWTFKGYNGELVKYYVKVFLPLGTFWAFYAPFISPSPKAKGLRTQKRIKAEVDGRRHLSALGVAVPQVRMVDAELNVMVTDYIEGQMVSDIINEIAGRQITSTDEEIVRKSGRQLGKIHAAGFSLIDAQPSNCIWEPIKREVYLVDLELCACADNRVWDLSSYLCFMTSLLSMEKADSLRDIFLEGYHQFCETKFTELDKTDEKLKQYLPAFRMIMDLRQCTRQATSLEG